ncbi:MAG: hypothetical protein KIH63_002170 [Candidatus Saccharibacteria bacterium]|nr:hypothetical protein [Candidatus Saccharibacteria bacterium]
MGKGETLVTLAATGTILVGGVLLYDEIKGAFNWFDDVGEQLGDYLEAIGDAFAHAPELPQPNEPYTHRLDGGILGFEYTQKDWPLFDRIIEIEPLEIIKDDEVKYEEESVHRVGLDMRGNLAIIPYRNDAGIDEVYVMAVNDGGTPDDRTDDSLVPIDVNKFEMISELGIAEVYDDDGGELVGQYKRCVVDLLEGDTEHGGCIRSGKNGHDDNVPPSVLENLRNDHLGWDGCVVRTATMASNAVAAGEQQVEYATLDEVSSEQTVTIGDMSWDSLTRRFTESFGLPRENVHVIMAEDSLGNAVQWVPSDAYTMTEDIESQSNGQYQPQDVQTPQFCFTGSWNNVDTGNNYRASMIERSAEMLFEGDWIKADYEPPVNGVPAEILQITFNADGTIIRPLRVPATTVAGQ